MALIPLTTIGGYLGAGKTTLINRLLRDNVSRRLAIVVNDFGDINIDASLITHRDAQTINLANGCICCTLGHDLTSQLLELKDQTPPPDHILIEASGVAFPGAIMQAGFAAGLNPDGVWVLVDAEQVLSQVQDRFVGSTVSRQLAEADVVVLNKADLVTDLYLEQIKVQLAKLTANTRWCTTQYGALPSSMLLGQAATKDASKTSEPQQSNNPRVTQAAHAPTFATWSYTSPKPVSEKMFRSMLAQLPDTIYRGKGYVLLLRPCGDTCLMLYQQVGARWHLEAQQDLKHNQSSTQLVFIGQPDAIDTAWLKTHLDPDLADA